MQILVLNLVNGKATPSSIRQSTCGSVESMGRQTGAKIKSAVGGVLNFNGRFAKEKNMPENALFLSVFAEVAIVKWICQIVCGKRFLIHY